MNRRLFLGAAAAGAALPFQKTPVRMGFLGATHSHAEGKLAVALASPEVRVAGVCEQDAAVREMLRGKSVPLLSREDLLRDPAIQLIAVESAVRDHARDGLAALEAGKHLHLEKAPSADMAGFQRVVDTARRKNLLLQVGYMWRYNPGMVRALEAGRQGWLGQIYMVRANIGNLLAAERRPEWAEFSGGLMFELGGHVVDAVTRLMGRPRKVTPFLRKDGAFEDTLRDNTVAVFEWDRAIGVVQGATMQPNSSRYRTLEIHGTNGSAIVNPIEQPLLAIELDKPAGPYAKGMHKLEFAPYKRYVDDLVELVAAVRGESKLRVGYEEDLIVHETLLRASGML